MQNDENKTNDIENQLISPEEVEVAVRGDESALLKQMDRVSGKDGQVQKEETKSKDNSTETLTEQKSTEPKLAQQQSVPVQKVQPPVEPPKPQPAPPTQEMPKEIPPKVGQTLSQKIEPQKEDAPKHQGFKRFIAFLFLGGVIAMIWFIPQINNIITDYQRSRTPVAEITTGMSLCTLEKTYDDRDVKTTMKLRFVNKKIIKLEYTVSTKISGGKEKATALNDECKLLKKEAQNVEGVVISCSVEGTEVTSKQVLNYEYINSEKLTNAYLEAGGVYPDVKKGDDIGEVESNLLKTGYNCSREAV